MRVCSFLPAATSIIQHLGLEHLLSGVTFECPIDRPRVVRSKLEGIERSSAEIDSAVSALHAGGDGLYSVDAVLLQSVAPDIIFTQDLCGVCQIDSASVRNALATLGIQPQIVSLNPQRLEDVMQSILDISRLLGFPEKGEALLEQLDDRLDAVQDRLRVARAPLRRVLLLEWIDPPFRCGHWIPEQIMFAGGVDALGIAGGRSERTNWSEVRRCDPEVLVIAACGVSLQKSAAEVQEVLLREKLTDIPCVAAGRVFVLDGALFTQPSAQLVDGVELLIGLFHPDASPVPPRLETFVLQPSEL